MATPIPQNQARVTAWAIAAAANGRVRRADGAGATGITSDSRAVGPGAAFFALRGEAHDGHDYVAAAAG